MSIHFVSLSLQASLPFRAAFGSALFNSSRMSGEGRADWPQNWVGRECGNWTSMTTSYFTWEEWEQHFPPTPPIFTVPLHLTGTLEHCYLHDQAVQQYPSQTVFNGLGNQGKGMVSMLRPRWGKQKGSIFSLDLEESEEKSLAMETNGTRENRRIERQKAQVHADNILKHTFIQLWNY